MKLGVKFKNEKEKLVRDVAEFRGASATARLDALLELTEFCDALLESSPQRARQLELLEERERLANERWREWIRRHVRGQARSDGAG